MNCSEVQELISLTVDGEIAPQDAEQLRVHLQHCAVCRNYQVRLDTSMMILQIQSKSYEVEAASINLDYITHNALLEEVGSGSRCKLPLSRLFEWILSLIPGEVRAVASVVSLAALLTALSYVLINDLVSVNHKGSEQIQLGHLESFSAAMDSEGRVYASVIERNSVSSNDGGLSK